MRRFPHVLALAGASLAVSAPLALAQCQVPLIVGSVTTTPNVLILLDTSGSMNDAIMHDAYDPSVSYSGNFTGTSDYNVSSDGYYAPSHFNSSWPASPTAYLVNSDQGETGEYRGNYLNWVYFHASSAERAAIPTVTRIQAAKAVINTVLTDITNVRFAVEIFNGDAGGTILSPFGTAISTMQSQVNAIRASSQTPLAESMETALNYFARTDTTAPIQAACQKSFVLLITDGFPTKDAGVSSYLVSNDCAGNDAVTTCTSLGSGRPDSDQCTGYVDNVACYMYQNDLRSDLSGIQNVATFVIGFGFNAPLLQTTANYGGGEYYTTNNVAGLVAALNQTFDTIARRIATGTSVAVVTAEDRTQNRLFRARYESGSWKGFVEAFDLPFQSGTPPLWEAGALLAARDPSTRSIYTSTTGTNSVEFSATNASTLQSYLGAADLTEATSIINYVRGDTVSGMRDRQGWVLGDVVDAAPVAVGKPAGFSNLPGYATFKASYSYRSEVLYVAGNDGMLHCFDTATGEEMWGYVPKGQLPRVSALMDPAYCHNYFVNTTPLVRDLPIGGTWKTVLFGGEEPGTDGMFALDVTYPSAGYVPVLWDVTVPRLQGSWNTPALIRDPVSGAYRLCVGTGYSSTAVADSLVVLDPENGQVLNRIGLGSAVAGNKTTRAAAIDTDLDGYDDLLYVGDLAGRLWRLNLNTNPWTKTLLFSGTQPLQAPPVLTIDPYGRPMIFFGTGQFLTAPDVTSTTTQAIYAVVDDGSGTTYTTTDLVNQSSTFNPVTSGSHGWYVDLTQSTGERVTRSAALVAGTLYVVSYKPSTDSCGGGGQSWLYTLDYKDGSAPNHPNGTENNTTSGRSQSMGDGMLADPTVDLVNEAILLQSSNAVVMSQTVQGGLKKLLVRGWRQKWN
jgi:type IV pilus assembly protein PilY1